MSGIVAIFNLDGSPVDPKQLRAMTDFLHFRGPDRQNVWHDGPVGMGHTLLASTLEASEERQPASLNGEVWITADARIDAREELIDKLKSHGCAPHGTPTDVELILRAYQVWGKRCIEHLLGDFVFAIWDAKVRIFFCVRDHFGVKPLYYAKCKNALVVSNTLSCLRLHSEVSDELDEKAVGDFLLFATLLEPELTTFADIRRLPAAHALSCSRDGLDISCYWTLPVKPILWYKKEQDYVDHFKELFSIAVKDRLRTRRIAVQMSGGIDSTTVAATAVVTAGAPDIHAFTAVYNRLIPDRERCFAQATADTLGIAIHYLEADNYRLYQDWDKLARNLPEPTNLPLLAIRADLYRQMADHGRVALTGLGGDPLFTYSPSYIAHLFKQLRFLRLFQDMVACLVSSHRLPGLGIRTALRRIAGRHLEETPFPAWLQDPFASRLELENRWRIEVEMSPDHSHPARPRAYASLVSHVWALRFEECDPSVTSLPIEVRHPFFDLRVVDFLLSIPELPWCTSKKLLRSAMYGILPKKVINRPKTPLAGNPVWELVRRSDAPLVIKHAAPRLEDYVNVNAVSIDKTQDSYTVDINLRPMSLDYWLRFYTS